MRLLLSCIAMSLAIGCRATVAPTNALQRFEFEHAQMGTLFRLVFYASDAQSAGRSAEAAFDVLDALDARMSVYDPDSELSLLSLASDKAVPTPWISVSRDLGAVLARAQQISAASDGAFDVTCGTLTRLWRRAIRERELPQIGMLERAKLATDWRALEIAPDGDRVRLLRKGMRLDLGGIAKGYALDRMLETLAQLGLHSALVDGGGDIAAGDPPPGERAWRVEVSALTREDAGPALRLELCRAAVATSGDLYRSVEIDGIRYSHIVDPRIGMGLSTRAGASVIAADGMSADALATAASVFGPRAAASLLARFPGCEARVIAVGGGDLERFESVGFSAYYAKR